MTIQRFCNLNLSLAKKELWLGEVLSSFASRVSVSPASFSQDRMTSRKSKMTESVPIAVVSKKLMFSSLAFRRPSSTDSVLCSATMSVLLATRNLGTKGKPRASIWRTSVSAISKEFGLSKEYTIRILEGEERRYAWWLEGSDAYQMARTLTKWLSLDFAVFKSYLTSFALAEILSQKRV